MFQQQNFNYSNNINYNNNDQDLFQQPNINYSNNFNYNNKNQDLFQQQKYNSYYNNNSNNNNNQGLPLKQNNNNVNNINHINNFINSDTKKSDDPKIKLVFISIKGKNHPLKINVDTTLVQFKSLIINNFKIKTINNLYYFNGYGVKKPILNEINFKISLKQKFLIFYLSNESNNKPLKKNKLINKNKVSTKNIHKKENSSFKINKKNKKSTKSTIPNSFGQIHKNNKDNYNTNYNQLNPNEIYNNNDNELSFKTINSNNFFNSDNSNYEDINLLKKEKKEEMNHFASISYISADIGLGDFINSAVKVSDLMNQINSVEKKNEPKKFYNPEEILEYPGLISNKLDKNDKKDNKHKKDKKDKKDNIFILGLMSKIMTQKGINVALYKNNMSGNKLDGASLQYLFNGFTEKKKYEIQFNLNKDKNEILLQKGDELTYFIDEWKNKISSQLNINKNDLFLVNPKNKGGLCLDLVTNEGHIESNKLKNFEGIKNIEEKSLIEGCQLSPEIFDNNYDNQDPNWGVNETRGGEKYLPPIGWYGYGLKVSKRYDNGDDTWINYIDGHGVFAIAYLGLSDIYGNKNNLGNFLNKINTQNVINAGYEQIYKNNINKNPKSKKEYQKCGNGVYLYQNPEIAENTASIIDIGGVRYKILLMCRVNPKKIRKPEGFEDCWILNPTPSEVRPYRILIKKIFKSPMSGASQNEIICFESSPYYFKNIIAQKDTTFLYKNISGLNNDDFVINLYTSQDYIYINNYLREGKIQYNSKYTEKEIKSWIWCLHKALTTKISNVKNGSIFYRGISRKFPEYYGVGGKFIFSEFVSVSEDKNVALSFACKGTLFEIRIENNDNLNYYCYNISKISLTPGEKEVLITANCTYRITKKHFDYKNSVDVVHLTCEGYQNN